MKAAELADHIWYDGDLESRIARGALAPGALLFRIAAGARNALYDAGVLRAHPLALPAVSVGNISVGGTGKTPVAAWLARELASRGLRPAIVLRGYGDDESLVHHRLNPDVHVVVSPDRVAGVLAARDAGADVAVLDDAFQHRRARRDVDLVLVSADRWRADMRVLPAGPLREPARALRRSDLVFVTRKAASAERAAEVAAWAETQGATSPGILHLAPSALVAWPDGERRSLEEIRNRPMLAVAAVGDPAAFERQLAGLGARVTLVAFRDHHRFTRDDAARLAARVPRTTPVVCTLKDVVKLGPLWPADGPTLWYVAQDVILERGREALSRSLERLRRPPA